MKLLALDGNSLINRAFYGIKILTAKDGQYTNAVYGFINILNRLLEQEKPDGVAVAFDLKAPTFRHKMFDAYKAGRHKMPEELASQFPILKEWLALAGYTCVECEGYEADDILGTLARLCEESGHECVISTGDRDSLQLISDRTRVLLAATKMGRPEVLSYGKPELFEKYGMTPEEMIELKALMGDSSDNIPGVPGVGEKTATDLISRFHSVEGVYANIDSPDIRDSVRNKLIAGKESAALSLKLGTICRTVPIGTDISVYAIRPADTQKLAQLMTRLEFFKLMEKMGLTPDNRKSVPDKQKAVTFHAVTPDALPETVTLYADETGFFACGDGQYARLSEEQYTAFLKDANRKKRVYNSKALYKQNPGISGICFDAMLAAYLCNPSASSYEPERLIQEYGTLPDTDEADFPRNACAFATVCTALTAQLKQTAQLDLLYEIELPLARVLADMETTGFCADRPGLMEMSRQLGERIAVIEAELYRQVGYEFNLNSPKQLGVALFEKLGLPAKKKTKSGYSTNAEVLEALKDFHPAIPLLLEYRQLSKLKSTYTDGLQQCITPEGRIHSTFNQTEARTGRISSLEPNLQNIPVRSEEGSRLRAFFTAPEGRVLCDADYSQIELRVLASMAKDTAMIAAFQSGTDIHTVTASQVFGIPVEMVTPLMRSRAKAVNFGIVYGIGAFSLSKDIGVTRKEADTYIKNYLATYPQVAAYMENTIRQARLDGFVTTLFGRRRYLPELQNSNKMLQAFGERVARNAPIQGTAADIIKLAMIRVFDGLQKDFPTARLILQVHDELIVECDEADAPAVCELLSREMAGAVSLSVPLTADAGWGKTWKEAKN